MPAGAALDAQTQLLAAAGGDLVLGPETIVPLLPEQLPADYWKPLALHFQRGRRPR